MIFSKSFSWQDIDFAKEIEKEYDIPAVKSFGIIGDLRDFINHLPEFRKYDALPELFAPDIEIKKINFDTNKGPVEINSNKSVFKFFVNSLQIAKKEIEREWNKTWDGDEIFYDYFIKAASYYSPYKPKGNFQRYVILGMFIVHFKLYKSKELRSKEEWKQNPTSDISYRHYLRNIARTRLKKHPKCGIQFPKNWEHTAEKFSILYEILHDLRLNKQT